MCKEITSQSEKNSSLLAATVQPSWAASVRDDSLAQMTHVHAEGAAVLGDDLADSSVAVDPERLEQQ